MSGNRRSRGLMVRHSGPPYAGALAQLKRASGRAHWMAHKMYARFHRNKNVNLGPCPHKGTEIGATLVAGLWGVSTRQATPSP